MPPDPISGTPKEWLARAKGKLALARNVLPENGFREDLCFFAQHAAELAIKAVYIRKGWTFEFVHNLGRLLDGLEREGLEIPLNVGKADQLTIYAAETRYPGNYPPVSQSEYEEAIEIAETVVAWAESFVQ